MKKYENFKGLSLYLQHSPGKASNLNIGLVEGRPRITIFLKDSDDKKIKFINIKLDYMAVSALLGLLKKATAMENPELQFDSFDTVFTEEGERTDDVKLIGSMLIHRNLQKQITLSVKVKDGKSYPFTIKINGRYHKARSGEMSITESKLLSDITTVEFAKLLSQVYSAAIFNNRYIAER